MFEIHRILKSGGIFLCSLVKTGSQILDNAIPLNNNNFIVNRGKDGLSNSTKIVAFDSENDVFEAFDTFFDVKSIGISENNYWGVHDYHYLICALRK